MRPRANAKYAKFGLLAAPPNMQIKVVQSSIYLYFFLIILAISGFFFAVIWPHAAGFYAYILFAAIGGLCISAYIFYTKKKGGILVCPTGSNCNVVVTSRYSKFFGVPLEYWGMAYYAAIIASYAIFLFLNKIFPTYIFLILIFITAIAFLFSLYLAFVQAFMLRQWCIWCLLSAILSTTIFIFSLAGIEIVVSYLSGISGLMEMVRAAGFALGFGASMTTLFLFSKFLRDFDIDKTEEQSIKGSTELALFGLVIAFVGQFALYVSNAPELSASGAFISQTIALFVIALSGAVFMIILEPYLALIPFKDGGDNSISALAHLRRPMFITGAIGIASWLFAFFAGYGTGSSFGALMMWYGLSLLVSLVAAFVMDNKYGNGKS